MSSLHAGPLGALLTPPLRAWHYFGVDFISSKPIICRGFGSGGLQGYHELLLPAAAPHLRELPVVSQSTFPGSKGIWRDLESGREVPAGALPQPWAVIHPLEWDWLGAAALVLVALGGLCNKYPCPAAYFWGHCPLGDARACFASCHPQPKFPIRCVNIHAVLLDGDLISAGSPEQKELKIAAPTPLIPWL